MLEFLEDIVNIHDKGHSTDIIYLDFSKAFDKVPWKRLIKKWKHMVYLVMYSTGYKNGYLRENKG